MKKGFLWSLVLVFLLALIGLYVTMPQVRNARFIEKNNLYKKIQLPFFGQGEDNHVYEMRGDIYRGMIWQKTVNLNVDNCLLEVSINNKNIFRGEECLRKPIKLDFSSLNYGKNKIDIKFRNIEGDTALYFSGSPNDPVFLIINIFLMVCLSILVFFLMKRLGLSNLLAFIFVAGLLLRLFYVSYTDYFQRDHDNGSTGHLGYIQYISKNFALPNPNNGWEYYQPPFYYVTAAVVYKMSNILNLYNAIKIQQIFNIFLFMGFIFYGWLIFKEFLKKRYILGAVALLSFWPSGVLHSARIGNDVMYYLSFIISFYFLIKWFEKVKGENLEGIFNLKNFKFLFLSVLFTSLTIMIKSNGLILAGIFLLLFLFLFLRKIKTFNFKIVSGIVGKFFILSLLLFIGLGINIIRRMEGFGKVKNLLVGNVESLNSGLKVQNNVENYLYFDLHSYLLEPFARPFDDQGGRNFLWVYVFKTAVAGEWNFNGILSRNIIVFLYFILLNLVILSFIGIFFSKKDDFKKIFVLLVGFVLLLLAEVFFRYKMPFACSQDFRYIFPVLVPFVVFIFLGIEKIRKKKLILLEYFGYFNITLFIILSIVYLILLDNSLFYCVEFFNYF